MRLAGLLGPPAAAVLIASGTTLVMAAPGRAQPDTRAQSTVGRSTPARVTAPQAIVDSPRYCYNWDFLNNTGQDANDLHIRLNGIQSISNVYTGVLNPFGAPDASSGYDAGAGVYKLNFSNGTVLNGDMAHIGLCTNQPVLMLPQGPGVPPFTWTLNGQTLSPDPLFAGLAWNWISRTHLRVQLSSDRHVSMTLMALNLLDAGNALELDDLNGNVVGQLQLVSNLAPDPVPLAPGTSSFFDVFLVLSHAGPSQHVAGVPMDSAALLEPNHPYVLEAVLEAEDDSGNTIHLYSQALSPLQAVYLPIARK
jgi:hypothetical protein